ncbi:MAG TPA: TetR family transcriptional regulator C-terminal domain-containing protein [Steroidobacteraceae bacterium]|nr:TetR family transcriptional regulator C-terminal domain-containing protein [Steroidobacteraceae bacterium]
MPKASLRNDIVAAGLRTMFRTGFNGCGVRDIVAAAEAPQGSFTNHFRSKEVFAGEVLDLYFEHVKTIVKETLQDESRTPLERLRRYLDAITKRLKADGFTRGCLIGDFSVEVAQQSEMLRTRLQEIYAEWLEPFAACIAEAQAAGELAKDFKPLDLADFLISSWEGAILRMKVERSAAPLERFKRIAFQTIFARGGAR